MFADVSESIRQLLLQHGNLDSGEVDIAFDMPVRDWTVRLTRPTVNLYLYDIRENTELRDPRPWKVRPGLNNKTAIKSQPLVRVDLTYNTTAFANAIEDEHRLLSRVLLTLLKYPILPKGVLYGALEGQEIPTVAARPLGIIQSPTDYWGALESDIKPSIDYRLTVSMDLGVEMEVYLARTSQISVGRKVNGHQIDNVESLPLQIGGKIHHKDDPDRGIKGATVTLVERALDTVTDSEGRYRFKGVHRGKYTLAVSSSEMAEQREEIEIPSDSYDVGV